MKPSIFHCRHREPLKAARRSIRFWIASLCLLLAMTSFFLSAAIAENQNGEKKPVYVLTMNGAISPAFSGYLESGLEKARAADAQLLLVELNTPGGLLSTTRDMAATIVQSPIPIAVWVTPSGAHAASAGTFIMYAAHIAAMDEGTNIGAATPVEMRGQVSNQMGEAIEQKDARDKPSTNDEQQNLRDMLRDLTDPNQKAMNQKAIEDTTAFIRGLAELRGRNVEWAEKAVTDADSITAKEALEMNVIDYLATSHNALLEQIDGKIIKIKNADPVTLDTAHAPIVEIKPDWKVKLLTFITDPNVALILMSIGVYGIILEFYNPGTMIPGTIGAISLILGLYALNILPISGAGIALILIGMLLMAAEAFVPSFGILGIGGLAAFIIGATIMFDSESMPGLALDWGVVWGIGLSGLILVALTVYMTVKVYRQKVSTGAESMIGSEAEIVEWDGTKGRVRVQGEIWSALSKEDLELSAEDIVLISAVDGLDLKIRTID